MRVTKELKKKITIKIVLNKGKNIQLINGLI